MDLIDFPEEILAIIIQGFDDYKDHFALAGSCCSLHERVFPHVRKLRFSKRYPLYPHILSKYTQLRVLRFYGITPPVAYLQHLTTVETFACVCKHYEPSLILWIIRQPLKWISMSWVSLRSDDKEKILFVPTLRCIQGSIYGYESCMVFPSVEVLSLHLDCDYPIQLSHLTSLRKLSISIYKGSEEMIDEINRITSLKEVDLTIRYPVCIGILPFDTLPIRSLEIKCDQFNDGLSPLLAWKQLSYLHFPVIPARQLEPLLAHPNKDHLYCSINDRGLACGFKLVTEMYSILRKYDGI